MNKVEVHLSDREYVHINLTQMIEVAHSLSQTSWEVHTQIYSVIKTMDKLESQGETVPNLYPLLDKIKYAFRDYERMVDDISQVRADWRKVAMTYDAEIGDWI